MENFRENLEEYQEIPHYYGDIVRALFMAGGMIMLVGMPFFKDIIPIPLFISVFAILIISLIAGITNPKSIFVITIDTLISVLGFITFEAFTIMYFDQNRIFGSLNQILGIIFFIAVYYSTKTLRAFLLRK